MADDLPEQFVRVVWDAGYGWPYCERRRRTARNFTREKDAGRQLAAIERWPSHHVLVGVWRSSPVAWEPVDPDSLPRPEPEEIPE